MFHPHSLMFLNITAISLVHFKLMIRFMTTCVLLFVLLLNQNLLKAVTYEK